MQQALAFLKFHIDAALAVAAHTGKILPRFVPRRIEIQRLTKHLFRLRIFTAVVQGNAARDQAVHVAFQPRFQPPELPARGTVIRIQIQNAGVRLVSTDVIAPALGTLRLCDQGAALRCGFLARLLRFLQILLRLHMVGVVLQGRLQ